MAMHRGAGARDSVGLVVVSYPVDQVGQPGERTALPSVSAGASGDLTDDYNVVTSGAGTRGQPPSSSSWKCTPRSSALLLLRSRGPRGGLLSGSDVNKGS